MCACRGLSSGFHARLEVVPFPTHAIHTGCVLYSEEKHARQRSEKTEKNDDLRCRNRGCNRGRLSLLRPSPRARRPRASRHRPSTTSFSRHCRRCPAVRIWRESPKRTSAHASSAARRRLACGAALSQPQTCVSGVANTLRSTRGGIGRRTRAKGTPTRTSGTSRGTTPTLQSRDYRPYRSQGQDATNRPGPRFRLREPTGVRGQSARRLYGPRGSACRGAGRVEGALPVDSDGGVYACAHAEARGAKTWVVFSTLLLDGVMMF